MSEIGSIGFIGVGRMGYPMAGHLKRAGFEVLAWDSNMDAVGRFHAEHGGAPPASLGEIGPRCDAVITMLPTSRIVREVILGGGELRGLVEDLRPGTVVIDTSTSDPHDTQSLGATLRERGIGMVDAPVAGGVVFARDGTLDILAGGDPSIVERVKPVLLAMGRSCTYCGQLGAAHAMKALNNYVNAAVLAVNLEAMVAARQFGVREATLLASLEAATMGRNHPYEKKIKPHILNRRFASGMAMGLIAKDVGIARDLMTRQGMRAPIVERVARLWSEAADELGFDRDQTEIARYWEESAGVIVGSDPERSD